MGQAAGTHPVRRHEALVACPRVMRPGLTDVPCEADLLVAVQGTRDDGLWIEYEGALPAPRSRSRKRA